MESHALHGDGLYFTADQKLWVTTFVPGTATWAAAGATITMETDFPLGSSATLKIGLKSPRRLTIFTRRPAWAGDGFALQLNDQPVADLSKPGTFVGITRDWSDGDTITLSLPHTLRTEPLPDNPNRVALMWGPLVLAGDFGPELRNRSDRAAAQQADFPAFAYADRPLNEWLKLVDGQPGTFQATLADGRQMTLSPFYTLHRRRYCLYWNLIQPNANPEATSRP
jgi:DUF1680 family protein